MRTNKCYRFVLVFEENAVFNTLVLLISGFYCPAGSAAPQSCAAGTYTNQTGTTTSSCLECPQGYYCLVNTSRPLLCPPGYWCEAAAKLPNQNPCPNGTFSNMTGAYLKTHCLDCTPGCVIVSAVIHLVYVYMWILNILISVDNGNLYLNSLLTAFQ